MISTLVNNIGRIGYGLVISVPVLGAFVGLSPKAQAETATKANLSPTNFGDSYTSYHNYTDSAPSLVPTKPGSPEIHQPTVLDRQVAIANRNYDAAVASGAPERIVAQLKEIKDKAYRQDQADNKAGTETQKMNYEVGDLWQGFDQELWSRER